MELLTPIPSVCLFAPDSSPSQGLLSKSHVPVFSLHPQWQTHISGWGMQDSSMDLQRMSYSVLSATDMLLHYPLSPWSSPPVLADLSTSEGAFPSVGPSLLLFLHPMDVCTILFSLFFYVSFILPGCQGIFLVLLGPQGILLVLSRCSVITVPFADVFLKYLWGEVSSHPPILPIWLHIKRF